MTTPQEKNISKNLYRYIIVLFLVTIVLRILLITWYNSNYGGIEQNVIYGVQRVMMHQPLYQDTESGSFAVMQYTPLYYYLSAAIARISGIAYTDVQCIYTTCRILALLFNLLTVCIVALIMRSWRYNWPCCFALATTVLAALTNHYYTRCDSMHLFLFTTAFYTYILYSDKGRLQYLFITALLSAACIMTKQSGILVCSIIGFCLVFIERRYIAALLYMLFTSCFVYAIALCCISDWQSFYQNAYLGLKNGIDASFLYIIFTSQFFTDMVPCYILGGAMVWLAVKKVADKTFRIIAAGAALSFLFAVITGLKIGSSNNYFTEFLLFVIAGVPFLLQSDKGQTPFFRIRSWQVNVRRYTLVAFIILITSKTVGFFSVVCIEHGFKNNKAIYTDELALHEYFQGQLSLKTSEHIFFTDRQFLDNLFIDNAIITTKDIVNQTYLANPNTFNYSGFIKGMNNGLIKYIVTDESRKDINEWNRYIPFILFDTNKFRLLATFRGYNIYAYSPR